MTFAAAGWALSPPCPPSSQPATLMPSSASQKPTTNSSSPGMDPKDQSRGIILFPRCEKEISQLPRPLERNLRRHRKQVAEDGVKVEEDNIRILSWNILSQGDNIHIRKQVFKHLLPALGTQNDGFVRCPPEALEWKTRRWRLMEELVRHQPDILCLQEVVKSQSIINHFL